MVVGAVTALFMGFLGIVQNDIKRVVAYSTLSQLGYMTVALGASAYAAGIFHLMTHAFFKALLFLAAGSVIIAMHHEQDIRKMGGLRKYMPVTYLCMLVGSLALIGFPGFSGFYSKDAIIEAVQASEVAGSGFAYVCVLAGVFVTALYSFRMFFLVFHGEERIDHHVKEHLHESPAVVTVPLILLAIPSVVAGFMFAGPVLFKGYFADSIFVLPRHNVLGEMSHHFNGPVSFILTGLLSVPFWFAMAGVAVAYYCYMVNPAAAETIKARFSGIYNILDRKYGFDDFNEKVFAGGGRATGRILWQGGDVAMIDGVMVNGTAKGVGILSGIIRVVQTGFLYHYAFAMIIGLLILLSWFVLA
jgi:NADH-quinone oxidoreductase subunit L